MPGHDIIVIGASAGGMEVLQALVGGLPPDLPAALFVVWHMPGHSVGVLPEVLGRAGLLPAAHARDGEPIESGRIYVAPPDRHLLLEPSHVRLTRGPKENHFRPAVDPLFRSAAAAYGPASSASCSAACSMMGLSVYGRSKIVAGSRSSRTRTTRFFRRCR